MADLELERRAVMEWLVARGHQPVHSYRPNSETVRESCLDDVDTCDLYVLILGHRYGFQPEETNPEKLSITHLEFRRAGQSSIPRIALIRTSVPDIRLSDLLDPQKAALVRAFEEEVRREVRPAEFSDLKGLIQGLSTGVESELDKLRAPSEHHRAEVWLAAHLQDVAKQFTSHMAASALKSGTRPEQLYLDLVVAEWHLGQKEEASPENEKIGKEVYPLQDVLQQAQTPLLLIGEGGAGKTTSLLYAAARAADRAKADQAAPVPIYVNLARLTKLDDVPDLLQLIADSLPLVKDWNELSDLGIAERRRILFLLDSFNEMPEHLQRNGAVVLQRFVEKQKARHACLIASRLVPHIEQLARPLSPFKTFEVLRLTSEQVRGFLQELGLGSLYERMPGELRELAGNPFMLLAIARTLAGAPEHTLPRNRGKLYQRFVRGWMDNEKKRQELEYSYERVKEPLLAYLAKRMTSAGQTLLAWTNDVEQGVESQLEQIHQRIKRRGGMPDDWTVDRCLDESLGDGLLKRVNEQLYFMHQSVQEYFTGLYFRHTFPDALVDFTPKLVWELVPTYELTEVPNHRFVPALLMMTGLLDDSTKIGAGLATRNPVLAAAAISSANRVDGSLLATLEQSWLDLLEHDDLSHRIVGCSCLALASMQSPRVIHRLVAFALGPDFNNSYVGISALGRLGAPNAIALELAERARNLPDNEYNEQKYNIRKAVKELQSTRMVNMLFEQWRTSPSDSSTRHRFEDLLVTVDRSLLTQELHKIRTGISDPATAADAERALTEAASWKRVTGIIGDDLIKAFKQGKKRYTDQVAETATRIRSMDSGELAACLRSSEPTVRAAAAKVAAERHVPVGDVVLESLVRVDQGWGERELISALVSLCGEHTAVSRLAEASREEPWCVGNLNPELAPQLKRSELSEAVKTEIERLGVSSRGLVVVGNETDGTSLIWLLSPSSWSSYRPRYQLRVSPGRLELYDCNVAVRAFNALAEIPGEASLTALQRAVEHDDPRVRRIAIEALAKRGDQGLAARLLAHLRSATSVDFIDAALAALGVLRDREALSLMNDLLALTDGEWSDVHPVWGPCPHSPGWGDVIHRTLVRLNADSDIQQTLDRALASEYPVPKAAALKEFSRWFAEVDLGPERDATWRTPERLQRLLDLALRDSTPSVPPSVRTAAAGALGELKSEVVQGSLVDALADNAVEMRVAAGGALIRLEAQELYGRVAETMLQVAKASHAQDLRRRAGKVLSAIPDGVEPFYQPIQEALGRGGWERVLELIEATLEIIPEDANLFWWRGHALRSLGRLDRAADSYQRAFELEEQASVIPQALAQTFLELGDFSRAMEAARRGVEIAPGDTDAQAVLAWSSYKAGAIPEAVEAASKAVDLDPVHGDAIWVVLLGHIRQANVEESHSAFQHALRVRQLLSPDLDTSFVTSFLKELEAINTDNAEISQLVEEIKDALGSESSGPN